MTTVPPPHDHLHLEVPQLHDMIDHIEHEHPEAECEAPAVCPGVNMISVITVIQKIQITWLREILMEY